MVYVSTLIGSVMGSISAGTEQTRKGAPVSLPGKLHKVRYPLIWVWFWNFSHTKFCRNHAGLLLNSELGLLSSNNLCYTCCTSS